jgi:hypothetical protein
MRDGYIRPGGGHKKVVRLLVVASGFAANTLNERLRFFGAIILLDETQNTRWRCRDVLKNKSNMPAIPLLSLAVVENNTSKICATGQPATKFSHGPSTEAHWPHQLAC